SRLSDFDSNRSGGIVTINLLEGDEVFGALLCSAEDDLLLVSANGQSIRFSATDEALRPMGGATSGVQGMRLNEDDRLLSLNVVRRCVWRVVLGRVNSVLDEMTSGSPKDAVIVEYSVKYCGGKRAMYVRYDRRLGNLVGFLVVGDDAALYVITFSDGVLLITA